jgi:hypothetical protein
MGYEMKVCRVALMIELMYCECNVKLLTFTKERHGVNDPVERCILTKK